MQQVEPQPNVEQPRANGASREPRYPSNPPPVPRQAHGFLAAVAAMGVAYLVIFPTVAAIGTILAFLRPPELLTTTLPEGPRALLIGFGVALLVGLAVALLCHRLATPQLASTAIFGELSSQVGQLDAQLRSIHSRDPHLATDDQIEAVALQEACHHRDVLQRELDPASTGLRWLLGTGYSTLWSRLHRAQEALVQVMPRQQAVAGALFDDLRLSGSDASFKNAHRLRSQVRAAARQLNPAAADLYWEGCDLDATGSEAAKQNGAGATTPKPAGATTAVEAPSASNGKPQASSAGDEAEARTILRQVTGAINQYRDEQWQGLLRMRNRLLTTVLVLGLVTYLLLGLAIAQEVAKSIIVAAVTFYLAGALIGLFHRLRLESESNSAVEDYGLAMAHLVHTPLFSGLAAVSGVLITAMLVGASGLGTAPSVQPEPGWESIFRLSPGTILIAALFGLTPSLLIDRLNQAQTRINNIQATAAPNDAGSAAS